ncbi:6-carboxytetrahydropterin synthase [Periweissella beninensis]|uniref:6-carboxy-5,6,7,8-tetrahydropterin synthase n=1 Tax=Periweissella beninensis TaxID=504936 RepID=A0ABT0VGW6_9LACO|nr:6-carboxytetrahydropterin synthase [Periweissella beninensis]MBM7544835.1 6-pyruvoyltetrahydropterin/6-carboxytetrahydropterin synthase [Periweissella beninensis]MCM2437066.1 6-carboxytetrahydropterin synthase [Periweissella beninensis]MCT4396675.1 6-pyruvoyl tetrahydropterin synthase [Periweissella beninensis]
MNKRYEYRLRTFINASHAVRWEQGEGQEHPHTWELILDIQPHVYPINLKFEDIEAVINQTLAKFSGQKLNSVAPFDQINPTLENFADYLFDILTNALAKLNCQLAKIEVGESPMRFYAVSIDR